MSQEDLFRTLFERSPDAIFIEDAGGHVLDCNSAAAALHRTSRAFLVGKHSTDLVPPEHRARVISTLDAPEEFESFSLTADGLSVPVSIRTSRIDYNGQPALVLNVRDVTDRKKFEQNLRALNDELELRVQSRTAALAHANEVLREEIGERNRAEEDRRKLEGQMRYAQRMEAVGRLAGGVAHDFNNLLTVIIGRCEVLMDRLGSRDPMVSEIMMIHDAAQKAASVTRQLLAFGRKQVLQPKILDVNVVITNMQSMLTSLVSGNIQLKINCGTDVWRIEADLGQIEQVILNLVVNSIDAMPDGGELEIETEGIELSEDRVQLGYSIQKGRYAVFSVRDTGRGMDPETLSHAFEPIFTTKEDKGTGLGLSSVYGIIKQSGGYVSPTSEIGKGTTFKIYLPGLDRPAEPLTSRNEPAPSGNETILLVEDAQVVREIARELLEFRGYNVIEAASGQEAIQTCETHDSVIDLMLSDIIMPSMNGRELAEQAARLRPGMKILLMSGFADEITRNQLVKRGFEFIAKPFTSSALAIKVREVLDRRSS